MRKILLFAVFSILFTLNLRAQLVIDFSADITEGCVPLAINFTDNSTSNGNIVSWVWDFGDGSTSEVQNPNHTYVEADISFEVCLTVTDDLAQTDTHCETAFITTFAEPVADAGVDQVLTCVDIQVTLDASGSSSGPEYTYQWGGPAGFNSQMLNPVVSLPGTYTLEVTNNITGCTATDSVDVFEDTEPPFAEIDILNTCQSPITLDIGNSSTGPDFIYEWQDQVGSVIGTDINVQVSVPGIYVLIVTNIANGCVSTTQTEVVPADVIQITLEGIQDVSCFGDSDGMLDISTTGGTPGYAYSWSNGMQTEDIFDLESATYVVTVTDSENCTAEETFVVSTPQVIVIEEETPVQQISCAGANDGAIDIIVSGGTLPYQYLWSTGAETEDITDLAPGVYTVTVTDANGCSHMDIKTVAEPTELMISATVTEATCTGNCDGVLEVIVAGGWGGYTYLWDNGNITPQITGICDGGTYGVTVTDSNGCSIETEIIMPDAPQGLSLDFVTTCPTTTEGGTIDLSVTGGATPYSYLWQPDGFTTEDITDLLPGLYTVVVTDANGCSAQSFIELGDGIESISGGNTVYCDGDQVQLFVDAPDAVSYNWVPADQLSCSDCPDPVLTVDLGGNTTFAVSIVESDGCIDEAFLDFTVQSYLDFNLLEFSNSPVAEGSPLELYCNVSNPTLVEWTGPGGFSSNDCEPVISNPDIGNEGTYTVNIIDQYGCEAVASVDVDVLTIIDSISVGGTICLGETYPLFVDAPDAVSIEWSPATSLDNPFSSSPIATPPGSIYAALTVWYSVIVEDASGNVDIASVSIEVNPLPEIVTLVPTVECPPGAVILTEPPDLPGIYHWTGPSGFSSSEPNIGVISGDFVCFNLEYTSLDACVFTEEICFDEQTINLCVWPGDTDISKAVDNFDLLNIGLAYDSVGPIREDATILWIEQAAPYWNLTHPGIENDFKHIDGNGDGMINADDTLAITQNWGETHNFRGEGDPDEFLLPNVNAPFYVEPDTLIEGESHSLAVILGDMNDPVDELYGLAFSLEYDSSVIVPGSAFMAFNDGWIGEKGMDMIVIQKTFVSPGRVDVGITRIDGQNMNGFGEIGQLNITIEDDILFQSNEDDSRWGEVLDAKFNISNIRLINNSGQVIPIDAIETSAVVDEIVGTKNIAWENHIQIQPNPARDAFYITTKNIEVSKVSLHQLTGEAIFTQGVENSTTRIDATQLTNGIYLVKVQTELGTMVERIVVLK